MGAVALAATLLMALPAQLQSAPVELDAASDDVELPAPEGRALRDPVPAAMDWPERQRPWPITTCVPKDCELWRADLPSGLAVSVGGLVIHGDQRVGSGSGTSVEPPNHGLLSELALSAVSVEDGGLEWRTTVQARRSASQRLARLLAVDEASVLVAAGHSVRLIDTTTGEPLWSAAVDSEVVAARLLPTGELILWGHEADARIDSEAPFISDAGSLISLDARTGRQHWRLDNAGLAALGAENAVVVLNEGELAVGIDLASGPAEPRWQRSQRIRAAHPPQWRGDGTLALLGDLGVEVIDPATGATLARSELDVDPIDQLYVIGDLIAVLTPGTTVPGSPVSVALHELGAPATEPVVIADVLDVLALDGSGAADRLALQRDPLDGLVIAARADADLELIVFGADGSRRAQTATGLSGECCWSLHEVRDDATFVLAPMDPRAQPAWLASVDDGSLIREVKVAETASEMVSWAGEVTTGPWRASSGSGFSLSGAGGRYLVHEAASLIAVEPVLLVQTADALIALDPQITTAPG